MASGKGTSGRHTSRGVAVHEAAVRRLLEGLPFMVLALDRAGRPAAWNGECRRVTGRSLEDLQSDGWRALFPDVPARRRWQRELAQRRKRRFRDWQWEVTTRTGERRILAWTRVAGRSPVAGWATWAVGGDVTAQAGTRAALRTLEEDLNVAQSVVAFGLWDMDPATGRVRWSKELERLYGLVPGSFGGSYQDFLAFLHPDDRAAFERRNREMEAARRPVFEQEFRIVRRDGAVRWMRSRSIRFRGAGGRPGRTVGINVDVTEQRQAEAKLRAKDEYLQVALRSSKLTVWHQDRRLRYTWITNPGLGFSPEDLVGRTDEEVLPGESARPLTQLKRKVLRTGRGVRQEVWLELGDRRGCYELVVEPQHDGKGRISGIVCASADVTERALAQEELELARQQLRRLAARLQDTIEEERRAIAQDVHDQVGAMITGIRMGLAKLAARLPAGDPGTREALRQVAELAERATTSTREICARIQPPSLEDVGLAETCRWYLRDWSRTTGLRATGRFPRLEPEPPSEISIDVFRTLQELLTNAARHSGGTRVRVSLGADRRAIRLSVDDDGRGFDPESARRGLGFTGLRERAARHGGRLDVRSGPRGSTVTMVVPRPASE